MLAPRPTPKLEDHLSSAVRGCLFNLITATLHIGGRFSIRNPRTRIIAYALHIITYALHIIIYAIHIITNAVYIITHAVILLHMQWGRVLGSVQAGTNKYYRQGAKKRPNLHIIRTVQTGKIWSLVESYHAYVSSSKSTM